MSTAIGTLPVRTIGVAASHGPALGASRRPALGASRRPALEAPAEWLVTNGLGGYASGLVAGGLARRYHGILIAALPSPLGRTLALDFLRSSFHGPDGDRLLEHEDVATGGGARTCPLREFRLEAGLPVWRFGEAGYTIEKRVVMPHRHNTALVIFRLIEGNGPLRLRLHPIAHVRSHDATLTHDLLVPEDVTLVEDLADRGGVEVAVSSGLPRVRWMAIGRQCAWQLARPEQVTISYETERRRGYDAVARLWSPGWVDLDLTPQHEAAFIVSTELWDDVRALDPREVLDAEIVRRESLCAASRCPADAIAAELTLAADQFLIVPTGRAEEVARTRALGDEPRTIIAGYHWFTDWGRDTMISLEGLTLATGRVREAGSILRTFGRHVRDGLIPNLFPEGERHGLYHTADATLWFFHAVDRYLTVTKDRATLVEVLPRLADIVEHHFAGTKFGIGVDPEDGLLRQGAPGYQLTWMDAKVGDWVVTPRRGKAVEVNALWYNALCLMSGWLEAEGSAELGRVCRVAAERARESFNERFWNEEAGCLFDVVDGEHGNDAACRPNQIFAISLPHPVLASDRWRDVLHAVRRDLVTPVGLRTLAPEDPEYRRRYDGDLRARDAAYHQGTVWPWLLGPFVDAWLKVEPDSRAEARELLEGLVPHLGEAGAGSISEIFDAESPYTPRGCIAQAWSVAEILRAWIKTGSDPRR